MKRFHALVGQVTIVVAVGCAPGVTGPVLNGLSAGVIGSGFGPQRPPSPEDVSVLADAGAPSGLIRVVVRCAGLVCGRTGDLTVSVARSPKLPTAVETTRHGVTLSAEGVAVAGIPPLSALPVCVRATFEDGRATFVPSAGSAQATVVAGTTTEVTVVVDAERAE